MSGFGVVKIEMDPGNLLILNSLLAHGTRQNRSEDRVRVAQYVSVHPAEEDNDAEWQVRVDSWRDREAPKRTAFPGDPWDLENCYETVEPTPLGEKLLGLES